MIREECISLSGSTKQAKEKDKDVEKAKEKDKEKKVCGLFPSSLSAGHIHKTGKQFCFEQWHRGSQHVLPLRSGQEGEKAIASRLECSLPDHCVTYLRLFGDLQQDGRSCCDLPRLRLDGLQMSCFSRRSILNPKPEACRHNSPTRPRLVLQLLQQS